MRVLFLSFPRESSYGGGERYMEQVAEGLLRAGHALDLVSGSRALRELFKRRGWPARKFWCGYEPTTYVGVFLFPLSVIVCVPIFLALLLWARFVRGIRVVVCLSPNDKLLATPFARLFGMRVIWMEHLVIGRSLLLNPYRGWYAACSRLVQVVTVSEAAATSLEKVGVPRKNIQIIFPGVAPRAEHVSPPPAPVVGAIARLSREKNVTLLLRAFALVHKDLPGARLEIFGDGPERPGLERIAKELGIADVTTFQGYVAHARSAGRFSVLAVSSAKESFGIAALEAMADGVPVVAARVGGLPEVVEDGVTGTLVPPDDPRAMADALLVLLNDRGRAARMGEAGRTRATRLFQEETMQRAWIALFS